MLILNTKYRKNNFHVNYIIFQYKKLLCMTKRLIPSISDRYKPSHFFKSAGFLAGNHFNSRQNIPSYNS